MLIVFEMLIKIVRTTEYMFFSSKFFGPRLIIIGKQDVVFGQVIKLFEYQIWDGGIREILPK